MECPSCHAAVGADDHFCGGCGRRLDAAPLHPDTCPTCGAPLHTRSNRCPAHGEMDPSWLRCPYCLREGRDGQLQLGELYCARCAPATPSIAATRLCPACGAAQLIAASSCEVCGADFAPAPVVADERRATTLAIPRPRAAFFAYAIETAGAQAGRAVRLHDPVTTIGRHPTNHLVVDDGAASDFHATIQREPDGSFLLTDRASTNGTRVNGRELTEPRAIRDNDEIGVGATTLVLKVVRPRARRR